MKKFYLLLLILFISIFTLSAEERYETVSFRANVPEDYGVAFPDEALRLDKIVFELPNGSLVTTQGLEDLDLEVGEDSITLTLLFYGNTEEDYNIVLDVNSNGWIISNEGGAIPVAISFSDFYGVDGIIAEENIDGSISLSVPAVGARQGDKVGELLLSWEAPLDMLPGSYLLELDISIRSRE